MRGFRAKDADRDRFVELIEAAYVDGQLGAEDRVLRVSRALSAETLDELRTLTRDLQPPPGGVPAVPAPAGAHPRRLLGVLLLLGAVVAVLGIGVAGLVLLADVDTGSGTSPSVAVESAQAQPVPVEAEAESSFEMTGKGVRRFLKGYEEEFGTLDVFQLGFYPTRVDVQVPVRGTRPRMEKWSFDGTWRRDTESAWGRANTVVFDAGGLDVGRLVANISTARKTLGVQRGRLTHVLVHTWTDGVPTVNIFVANSLDESGFLKTSMRGELIGAYPHEP